MWMLVVAGALPCPGQDAREQLGPADRSEEDWAQSPHPLEAIRASVHADLRPELHGIHPRVYVTDVELDELRLRARTTQKDRWQKALSRLHPLHHDPPQAPAQERRVQNRVGIGMAEAALAYKIEGDQVYLDAAKRYMDAAVSYDVWGYIYNKPDVDLAAGHLLYGLGWAYDLLYHDLNEAERVKYRDKLIRQARILFDYYDIKRGRSYSYSQNHVFIPMAGLAVTAYALYDEVEEAAGWALLARTLYQRVLATYSADGYYYEGFEYWVFATPWVVHYLDVQLHAAGEDLWDEVPGFRSMHRYVAHSVLPDGVNVFDFGDTFEGAWTRMRTGEDHLRTHPEGRLHSNYNVLYRLAARYRDPKIQGVAEWLRSFEQVNMEDFWTLLWYDDELVARSIDEMTPYAVFTDHGLVYWRSDWTPDATAIAFKCGPPEGHKTAFVRNLYPDWHLATGHAHPDAGSFILYARGTYLTGDSGWTGVPMTAHHNTVLFDGGGQAREGDGHDAFHGVPYERLNRIRILRALLTSDRFLITGDATAAYEPHLGVERFTRTLRFKNDVLEVNDEILLSAPRTVSRLVQSDQHLECRADRCRIGGETGLILETVDDIRLTVENNDVTAPGDPGSVDEGPRQVRGLRAIISTATPVRSASLSLRLSIDERHQ